MSQEVLQATEPQLVDSTDKYLRAEKMIGSVINSLESSKHFIKTLMEQSFFDPFERRRKNIEGFVHLHIGDNDYEIVYEPEVYGRTLSISRKSGRKYVQFGSKFDPEHVNIYDEQGITLTTEDARGLRGSPKGEVEYRSGTTIDMRVQRNTEEALSGAQEFVKDFLVDLRVDPAT